LNETAQIYFKVLDSNGNPVQGQTVNFTLSTTAGGLSVSPTSAISTAAGEVETIVESGTVHTSVRVIATIANLTLTSQSSLLTVSTGFPAQNGLSVASTSLNLVGDGFDGNTTTISARMLDRYQNPVPDGTAVSFTTECGGIQPSCNTVGGVCTVTFTTENPRTGLLAAPGTNVYKDNYCAEDPGGRNASLGCNDHRCTILAYAVGEESFNDCNGNGVYTSVDNPANNANQCPNGDFFVSLPEAWMDSNESGVFNGDFETFIDFQNTGTYEQANGEFIGLLCSPSNPVSTKNCDPTQTSLNVFLNNLVIVMASDDAQVVVYQQPGNEGLPEGNLSSLQPITPRVTASTQNGITTYSGGYIVPGSPNFGYIGTTGTCTNGTSPVCTNPVKGPLTFTNPNSMTVYPGCTGQGLIFLGDSQWQPPAVGTTISVALAPGGSGGTLAYGGSDIIGNTDAFGYLLFGFGLTAPTGLTSPGSATVLITTTVPATATLGSKTVTYSVSVTYPSSPPTTGSCY
jgi:hypothetical protein